MDEGLKEAELEVKDRVGVESRMIHIASGCFTTVVAWKTGEQFASTCSLLLRVTQDWGDNLDTLYMYNTK